MWRLKIFGLILHGNLKTYFGDVSPKIYSLKWMVCRRCGCFLKQTNNGKKKNACSTIWREIRGWVGRQVGFDDWMTTATSIGVRITSGNGRTLAMDHGWSHWRPVAIVSRAITMNRHCSCLGIRTKSARKRLYVLARSSWRRISISRFRLVDSD